MAFAAAVPASAQGNIDLLSPDTILVAGDVRLAVAEGERAWLDGEFGKLRFGGPGPRVRAALGSADLVWQPKLGWAWSATVAGSAQQHGDTIKAGLSEAFISFKPLTDAPIKFSARAGLMWPPVSLEHSGAEWQVRDTITPSAINSWMGEEGKFVGAEATATGAAGGGKLALTGAIVDANDTAGALLAFRGWAMHDIKTLAWQKLPLPPLGRMLQYQPDFTHPLMEIDGGFLKRPGWYVRAAWQLRAPVKVEVLHYDNGSDPESVDAYLEWGWRTRYDNVGLTAELAPGTELRAQGMRGHTLMGFPMGGKLLVDMRFRSAYAMVTQRFGDQTSVSGRFEAFETENAGSVIKHFDDEHGWAVTAAAKHAIGPQLSALVELMHVDSRRVARQRAGAAAHQVQTQIQSSLRWRW